MKSAFLRSLSVTALLLALLFSFASCGREELPVETTAGETVIEENLIPVTITEYTVIRPEAPSEDVLYSAVSLRKRVNELLGSMIVDIKDDWIKGGIITDEINSAKEILIGNTNRPESKQALEGVDPTSFVIKQIGNKIVINSERSSLVSAGVEFFIDNYLQTISGEQIMLPEGLSYISEPLAVISFIADSQYDIDVVYLDSLDNSVNAKNEYDRLDLDVVYAKKIRDSIEDICGLKLGLATDWYKPGTDVTNNYEILVGNTERDETSVFLSSIAFNQYGFGVVGNKIVVAGWNETTTSLAVNKFLDYFEANYTKNSDGTINFSMIQSEKSIYDYNKWYVEYPTFDGGICKGTQDAGYGNLQAYYEESTLEAYNSYCKKLEESGFTLYMQNTITGNVHKAYTSAEGMLYVYYVAAEKSVRIVSCPKGEYNLPQYTSADAVPVCETIAEPSITQMSLSYSAGNFGLCHIITLADGSFIVYDGGGNSNNDYIQLYETLKSLNKRPDGKIVIAGWFLTHEHWDHYTNFSTFCKNYSSKVVLEGMYCNTPSGSYAYNGYNPNYYMTNDFSNLSSTLGGVPKYIVHTGMKFYLRNACIEIIYTQEDLYPTKLYYFNDCTMVSRVTIAGQTITYLGDVRYEGSDIMSERYGSNLKCDIVQVSHHGFDGGTVELYKLLTPETCLWPTSKANFDKMSAGSTSSGYLNVDTFILKTLKVPTNIYAEPTSTIMLPFKTGDKITYWDK